MIGRRHHGIWDLDGFRFVCKEAIRVRVHVDRIIALLAAHEHEIFEAVRDPSHLEHRVVERFAGGGHRCVSLIRIHDGTIASVESEEWEHSPLVSWTRQVFPDWVVVTRMKLRSTRSATKVTTTIWFRSDEGFRIPGHAAAINVRSGHERLRDVLERMAAAPSR